MLLKIRSIFFIIPVYNALMTIGGANRAVDRTAMGININQNASLGSTFIFGATYIFFEQLLGILRFQFVGSLSPSGRANMLLFISV